MDKQKDNFRSIWSWYRYNEAWIPLEKQSQEEEVASGPSPMGPTQNVDSQGLQIGP